MKKILKVLQILSIVFYCTVFVCIIFGIFGGINASVAFRIGYFVGEIFGELINPLSLVVMFLSVLIFENYKYRFLILHSIDVVFSCLLFNILKRTISINALNLINIYLSFIIGSYLMLNVVDLNKLKIKLSNIKNRFVKNVE